MGREGGGSGFGGGLCCSTLPGTFGTGAQKETLAGPIPQGLSLLPLGEGGPYPRLSNGSLGPPKNWEEAEMVIGLSRVLLLEEGAHVWRKEIITKTFILLYSIWCQFLFFSHYR